MLLDITFVSRASCKVTYLNHRHCHRIRKFIQHQLPDYIIGRRDNIPKKSMKM